MKKLLLHALSTTAAVFVALHVSNAPAAVQFTTIYNFDINNDNGQYPAASLIQGLDGAIYGTASKGGSLNNGTVFRLDPLTNTVTALHNFDGVNDNNGGGLLGSLVQAGDGTLYGATTGVGNNFGTLFRINADGSNFATLFGFTVQTGIGGIGLTLGADGALYGPANSGGPTTDGLIYRFDPATNVFFNVHSFSGIGPGEPYGNVIQGSDGVLYGTTQFSNGNSTLGSVFRVNTDGSGFLSLHDFNGADGSIVNAGLVLASDGFLYGVAEEGGATDNGTVFRIRPDGTGFAVVHSFNGADGRDPFSNLIQGSDGLLYGTTRYGGSSGSGTVFQIDPANGNLTTLHHFSGTDGNWPFGGLLQASDGYIYGTARYGGAQGSGTIFRFVKTAGPNVPPVSCTSNFNGTAIAAGSTIWFNSNLSVSNLNTNVTTTIKFLNQVIDGLPGGPVSVPDTTVVFTPALGNASATFGGGSWLVNLPTRNLAGNAFLSGAAYTVPSGGLPGGISPVTWSGSFTTDQAGVQVQWKWGAAVYTEFSTSAPPESGVSVKSVDDNKADLVFKNSDHAGTPENFKKKVTGGARGGGGSNYTGSWSGTCTVVPMLIQ